MLCAFAFDVWPPLAGDPIGRELRNPIWLEIDRFGRARSGFRWAAW